MRTKQPVHEPSGTPKIEPLIVSCQFCDRDLSGLCNAIFEVPEGKEPPKLKAVTQPLKCKFCGRHLLYRRESSRVWRPGDGT